VTDGLFARATRRASLVVSRNELVRPRDRAESAMLWLVTLLMMAAVPLAATVGSLVYEQQAATAHVEQATRHQVTATLQQDVADETDYTGTAVTDVPTSAWWRTPDGRTRIDVVPAPAGLHRGDTTRIWIDQHGDPSTQPRTTGMAAGDGTAGALGVLLGAGMLLASIYWTGCFLLRRASRASWGRAWRAVEPGWSRESA
jgi:hypothetical protein